MSNCTQKRVHTPKLKRGWWNTLFLALTAALLSWMSFPPMDIGLFAWIALVPWFILIALCSPVRAGIFSLAIGFSVFVALIHWLRFVTTTGWIALAVYCALYFSLAGVLLSWLRRRGFPFFFTAPLVVPALEFARAHLFSGFPFYFLGHTQYQQISIIQIADLTGTYGVTFLITLVNACLAELLMTRLAITRRNIISACTTLLFVACTLTYGFIRKEATYWRLGPKLLLVQGNVSQELKHSPDLKEIATFLSTQINLSRSANGADVDMVIWPETMFPAPLNPSYRNALKKSLLELPPLDLSDVDYQKFQDAKRSLKEWQDFLSDALRQLEENIIRCKAYFLVGAETDEPETQQRYNSAYFFSQEAKILGRYDKMHLVVFGEYTPFADVFSFLRNLRPPVMGPDLRPGLMHSVFDLPFDDQDVKFGVTICYEDADASLFRKFVQRGAVFMVNITNDGWFRDSSELDHHLSVCAFRAVENRVPIARCANTGISALIEPNGHIAEKLVDANGKSRGVRGTLVGKLALDSKRSFYSSRGDVFAWLASAGAVLCVGISLLRPAANEATKFEKRPTIRPKITDK